MSRGCDGTLAATPRGPYHPQMAKKKTKKAAPKTKVSATKAAKKRAPARKPARKATAPRRPAKKAAAKRRSLAKKAATRPKPRARAKPAGRARKASPPRSLVGDYVFYIFRGCFGGDDSEFERLVEVLDVDPNEWDMDPSPFYGTLEAVFRVADPTKMAFDGYGGTVRDTVKFITSRWKGGALPPLTKEGIPWGG